MKRIKIDRAFGLVIPATKGGVAKTTSCITIGSELASKGYKTLIVDMDPQGNVSTNFGLYDPEQDYIGDVLLGEKNLKDIIKPTAYNNLYIIPSNLNLINVDDTLKKATLFSKDNLVDYLSQYGVDVSSVDLPQYENIEYTLHDALEEVRSEFDFILIDVPPYYNTLVECSLYAADGYIVPVGLDKFALEGFKYIVEKVKTVLNNGHNIELIGIIPTKYRRTSLHNEILKMIKLEMSTINVFDEIPNSVKVEEAPFFEKTLTDYQPYLEATMRYRKIADFIIKHVESRG